MRLEVPPGLRESLGLGPLARKVATATRGVIAPRTDRRRGRQPDDPVTAALPGDPAGAGETAPAADVLRAAEDLLASLRARQDRAAFDRLVQLVGAYPEHERLQVLAARGAELVLDRSAAAAVWSGVYARFPTSREAFRLMLRWTVRELGRDAGFRYLRARFPELPADAGNLLLCAWGYDELRAYDLADQCFARAIELDPQNEAASLQAAQSLVRRGEFHRAVEILRSGCRSADASSRLRRALERAEADLDRLSAFAPAARSARASEAVLDALFDRAVGQPLSHAPSRGFLGPVLMVIGTLGAGGAERQFATTAQRLQAAVQSADRIGGHDILGPVHVWARSLTSRPGGDFFAPALSKMGLPIVEYARFEPFGGSARHSMLCDVRDSLDYLPQTILEGTTRLADRIRHLAPDVVQIWQDGSILSVGLAALMAGVPRIVLNVRSMPPIDRPDRYRPEYEVVFRRLLALPQVRLVSNSRASALRYAEWLGVDPDRVEVIYNGVDRLPTDADAACLSAADAFDAATAGHDFTVGTVMRFDENKRPFLWLDAAATLLRHAPRARFVMVGDGPMREPAWDYAAKLGIASRVHFAGRSAFVGYWLTRMDAFLLLSKVEGLPNVLIEAQRAGVPVVATPVGGAAETFQHERTGLLLPRSEDLTPTDVAARLLVLKSDPQRRAAMGLDARRWAQARFSVGAMIERTVRAFMD
jgi:glycosyltransferase involved in cell wall biosynthesis/Flp pilus assembly protein TadD